MYAMQPRYKTEWAPCGKRENVQDYYVALKPVDMHCDYWESRQDPNGVLRNRNTPEERRQYQEDIAYLTDRVNAWQPASVLDVGAGLGWLLALVDCRHKSAVETSAMATAALEMHGVQCYDRLVDVPSNSQDVVITHHVIEHMLDPVCQVNHMRRALHPGGRLVIATPDFMSPCAKRFGARYRMLHDATHISLFSLDGLLRMLRDLAFRIEDVVFPFPDRYATAETMARWRDISNVSPPWPGNWVTVFCRR